MYSNPFAIPHSPLAIHLFLYLCPLNTHLPDMKFKSIYVIALVLLIASCNNKKETGTGTDGGDTAGANVENVDEKVPVADSAEERKKITARDYSISKDEAYNDMFLDSMAMERYIASRQLADKKLHAASGAFIMPEITSMPGSLQKG